MQKAIKIPTEEKVLNAALKEFAQHGFDGARVDRIARIAKVNKAMIYYHYKGKEALYERVLTDAVKGIYQRISSILDEKDDAHEQIYKVVSGYVDYLQTFDLDFFRVMLREISSGGKYFRKIALPNLIGPLLPRIVRMLGSAIKEKQIREINPYYTFLHIVGGIVFFNSLRISLEGTELFSLLYHEGYSDEFKQNLVGILKYGIEMKR